MTPQIAANKVAEQFVENTKVKIDPSWIVALVEVIISIIKYCDQKNNLQSLRRAIRLSRSPLMRYFGTGRRTRVALKKAILSRFTENCDELVEAMLKTADVATDEEIMSLMSA